jgi:hypothetical protein
MFAENGCRDLCSECKTRARVPHITAKKIERIEMIGGGLDPTRQLVQSEPGCENGLGTAGDCGLP